MEAVADRTVDDAVARITRRGRLVLVGLALLFVVCAILSIGIGPVSLSPGQVLTILFQPLGIDLPWQVTEGEKAVVLAIRLPRTIGGLAVGAALAASGATLQGLFRNPLADPGLIGVSGGAALAAVAMIVLGTSILGAWSAGLSGYLLPIAAFFGGLVATVVAFRIASSGGRVIVATMLLAGVAIGAITGAGIGAFVFIADDDQLRTLNFWLLGSLAGTTWDILLPALPLLVLPVLALPVLSRGLNLLALGEQEAGHLGLDVETFKRILVVLVTVATGAAVAISGVIAFVGLVVPHMLRLSIGPDHRILLPGAALLGAALLIGADIVARTVVSPAELPIGIITSLIGGPFFLWLLLRQRRHTGL